MDWNKGYSSTYYMTHVDPVTWRDLEVIQLTGGSIKREGEGLRESATIDCVNYPQATEQWIRVWLDTKQGGGNDHTALFTGLATSPGDEYDGPVCKNQVECYSVLKPVNDVYLMRGWYAPAGANGAELVKELLSVSPAPVDYVDGAPPLTSYIIAEEDETRLTMAEKVLVAIGWRLRIEGDGSIIICPVDYEPVAQFDPLNNDIIEPDIKIESDWFDCPNVFMAINDDETAIARDDSLDSPLSTVNRGREVWMQESGCDLATNETLSMYAQRRLKEEQRVQTTASYQRRYTPAVRPSDVIWMRYPKQGLEGRYRVISQDIELTHAARTSEEITSEV